MLYWVPDFRFLLHQLHKTCKIFSASTPGQGFFSTPSITNTTAKVVAHRIIVRKENITCSFPCEVRLVVLVAHEVLTHRYPRAPSNLPGSNSHSGALQKYVFSLWPLPDYSQPLIMHTCWQILLIYQWKVTSVTRVKMQWSHHSRGLQLSHEFHKWK